MKITKIEEQKKNKNRMSVFIDGAFAFGIDAFSLYALKLKESDEVSEERLALITDTILFEDAKNYAAKLLTQRSYTERDMKRKIKDRTGSDEVTEKTIAFLKEYKLIDDVDFAHRYAKDCLHLKKYGKQKIKFKLLEKGISKEIAEETIESICSYDDELNTLFPLIEKKLGGNFDIKNVMKTKRYFASRGYRFDEIDTALRKLKAESEEWPL